MKRISVIGAGYVGATIAYALDLKGIANDIVLIDTNEDKARAEADDIRHGIAAMGESAVRAGSYADCADCDLIIVTAGRNRLPNESRLDMIQDNIGIMKDVSDEIARYYTRGAVMIVSNPVDLLTYYCDRRLGLPNGTVFGTGCILDTSRLVRAAADYFNIRAAAVNGYVIGEHGESQVPVWSAMKVSGVAVEEYCLKKHSKWDASIKATIQTRVKNLGTNIISAKGRTHYGIATCVCMLTDAIINHKNVIASVSSPLTGEYGIDGVALSLPSKLCKNGVAERIITELEGQELEKLYLSAEKLKNALSEMIV